MIHNFQITKVRMVFAVKKLKPLDSKSWVSSIALFVCSGFEDFGRKQFANQKF